jgi:hypothetical protein
MRKVIVRQVNSRKYEVVNGEDVINALVNIIMPGGIEIEGKMIVTKNFIGILEKGMRITSIEKKFHRDFYDIFFDEKNRKYVIAENIADAEETINAMFAEEEAEEEEKIEYIKRTTVTGDAKARLSKEDKEAFKEKFEKEIANKKDFKELKTIKEKVIYLSEAGYPPSTIAYILGKKFQQVRGYIVAFMGRGLKEL